MPALPNLERKFTEEEYFDLLIHSKHKYEFDNGKVTLMAGGKAPHNRAKRNLTFQLQLTSEDKDCEVFDSDTAVYLNDLNRYYFPDASVVCGPVDSTDKKGIERLFNPSLLVEVLSKSTEKKDTSIKFEAYKTLPSLREYVIVHSKWAQVFTYYRETKGLWQMGSYWNLEQEVRIETLNTEIAMADIYRGLTFSEDVHNED